MIDSIPADSIGARAARQGVDPRELAYDLLLENGGRGLLLTALANYGSSTPTFPTEAEQAAFMTAAASVVPAACTALR